MRKPLTVAAVQPACAALDPTANAWSHAHTIRSAQARVVVFPELSLTGYELRARAVRPDDDALAPIIAACAETGSVALVGAPVADAAGREFIGMIRVDADGARPAYHKSWLGGTEAERFTAGDGPTVLEIDGWRLGLGICKDTGAAQHTVGTADLEIDAYLAGLVHQPQELAEQEARAVVLARTCRAYVVFASFAGPTGDVFSRTAGRSAIWSPAGEAIARAGPDVGDLARTVLA